jgi:tRNA pseudouridine13 synthase
LAWTWQEAAALSLSFSLPPGSYATALLQELGEVIDATRN